MMAINKRVLIGSCVGAAVLIGLAVLPTSVWEPVNLSLLNGLQEVRRPAGISSYGLPSVPSQLAFHYAVRPVDMGSPEGMRYYGAVGPVVLSDQAPNKNWTYQPALVAARQTQVQWPEDENTAKYTIKPVVAAAPTETGRELIERFARMSPRQNNLASPRLREARVVSNEFGWPRLT